MALTFDLGFDDTGITKILSTLQSTGTTATFFMVGTWAQAYPALARQIATTFAVGNDAYEHEDLTTLPDQAVSTDITQGTTVIQQITGRSPVPLFRFPSGAENAHTRQISSSLGYGDFRWTTDTLGYMGFSNGQSVNTAVARVMANLSPGELVLMHGGASPSDGSTIDADALPIIIANLRAQGYGFVRLDQFLASLASPSPPPARPARTRH